VRPFSRFGRAVFPICFIGEYRQLLANWAVAAIQTAQVPHPSGLSLAAHAAKRVAFIAPTDETEWIVTNV
jgi:hypothetical protein